MVPDDVAFRMIRRLAAGRLAAVCKCRRHSDSTAFPLAEQIVYAWYDEALGCQKFILFSFFFLNHFESQRMLEEALEGLSKGP